MNERKKISIKFEGFKFLRFSFEQQEDVHPAEKFDFEIRTNIETYQSGIIVKVLVRVIRKSIDKQVAFFETASLISIVGIEHLLSEKGVIIYPEGFLITPISLAISTTRGAIMVKGAGTFLGNIPLPIVDPRVFVPKMVYTKGSEPLP
jgi:hypothetical protein